MFVVDLHTLQTIYILNLIHDILLYGCGTLDGKDVTWGYGTVRQRGSGAYIITLLNKNLLGEGHQIFFLVTRTGNNGNFTVTSLDLAHVDCSVNLRNHCRIGRITGLEQFCDTRQTTGYVTGLTLDARNLHQYVTGCKNLAVLNHNVSAHRKIVRTKRLSFGIYNVSCRNPGLVLCLDDDDLFQTC